MVAEKYWNLTITYPNHEQIITHVKQVDNVKKQLTPELMALKTRIEHEAISKMSYTISRLPNKNHLIIYVNPQKYAEPRLLFYDRTSGVYSQKIPYEIFISINAASIYDFEDKCRGIVSDKYKCYMNEDTTRRIEQALLKDVDLD